LRPVFDIGFLQYDISTKKQEELEEKGSRLFNADFQEDGYLYVDDTGLGAEYGNNLHQVDLRSKSDRVVFSKRSILEPVMSPDKKSIAFIEVESTGDRNFDNLWIYTLGDGSFKKLYRGPAKPKIAGVGELQWSPDGRYIGMFISPDALVLEIENASNIYKLRGGNSF
jgi:dipeptidyl aminopeptidase/acylaminoacyl peptidase